MKRRTVLALCAYGAAVAASGKAFAAPALDVEEIEFQSKGATISGIIMFPETSSPKAAVVVIQGSGPTERMFGFARLLSAGGFAVLTYDKRGVGRSGGVYEGQNNTSAANLDLLASDAAAAIKLLEKHPRLRGVPAGFVGVSQAGWIAPLALTKSPNTAFMGLWSGPICTPSEERYFSKLAENDTEFWNTHTAQQVADYMKAAPNGPDEVDPRTSLNGTSIPALWLFGGKDNSIPVDLSVARLERLIAQGQTNFEYKIFPGVGHDLVSSYKDAAYQYMVRWLDATAAKLARTTG